MRCISVSDSFDNFLSRSEPTCSSASVDAERQLSTEVGQAEKIDEEILGPNDPLHEGSGDAENEELCGSGDSENEELCSRATATVPSSRPAHKNSSVSILA